MMNVEIIKLNNYSVMGADIPGMNADRAWQRSPSREEFYVDHPEATLPEELDAYCRFMDELLFDLDIKIQEVCH